MMGAEMPPERIPASGFRRSHPKGECAVSDDEGVKPEPKQANGPDDVPLPPATSPEPPAVPPLAGEVPTAATPADATTVDATSVTADPTGQPPTSPAQETTVQASAADGPDGAAASPPVVPAPPNAPAPPPVQPPTSYPTSVTPNPVPPATPPAAPAAAVGAAAAAPVYGQPGWQAPPPGPPGTSAVGPRPYPVSSNSATVALVLAIVSWVACPIVAAIIALIFASKGSKEIKASNGWITGDGLVLAARIIAWLNIGIMVLALGFWVVLFVIIGANGGFDPSNFPTNFPTDFSTPTPTFSF